MAREMKDSGIAWIGEVPKDWKIKKLKYCSSFVQEKYDESYADYSYIGLENIVSWSGKFTETESSYDKTQSVIFHEDDILWGKLRPYLAKVYHCKDSGCCSSEFCVIRINADQDIRYFWNLLISSEFIATIDRSTYGTKMPRANSDFIRNTFIPVPPLNEQKEIAKYLDIECGHIDAVMEQTRASIEDYKKLKQAVITQAVTKGIRPNHPMKDSGVDWIGAIANDFQVMKLKYICDILDNFRSPITADQRNQDAEILYDYYGASGAIDKIDGYTIDDHVMLIGEDGANLRMRNLPLMYEVNGKAWINNHAHILKPKNNIQFYYLFFALEALDINPYITGSAQPKLSQENLQNIWVPVPSCEEQIEIVNYIQNKINVIDAIKKKKEDFLNEMDLYKKSVIFEYVTGKKEVPL